jgi:hypothetical protein
MLPEIQQAIERLERDEFLHEDVRTLIGELRRIDSKPRAKGEPKPRIQRARDMILDALALTEISNLSEVTPSSWSRLAKCKKELLVICPDVTPLEIAARAARYKKEWPKTTLSADALVKWWGKFGQAKAPQSVQLGENLR